MRMHLLNLPWYNVKRLYFGKGMSRKPPLEKLKDLGYNLPEEFALLPPIILDDVSTFWAVRGGNNLLVPYTLLTRELTQAKTSILYKIAYG